MLKGSTKPPIPAIVSSFQEHKLEAWSTRGIQSWKSADTTTCCSLQGVESGWLQLNAQLLWKICGTSLVRSFICLFIQSVSHPSMQSFIPSDVELGSGKRSFPSGNWRNNRTRHGILPQADCEMATSILPLIFERRRKEHRIELRRVGVNVFLEPRQTAVSVNGSEKHDDARMRTDTLSLSHCVGSFGQASHPSRSEEEIP